MENVSLKEQILELEFNSIEEEDEMVECHDIFVKGGLDILGKNAFELAKETGLPSYQWNRFLSLLPVRNYISNVMDSIVQSSANNALINIMGEVVSAQDVSRMKALTEMANNLKKKKQTQTYIVTRVPRKDDRHYGEEN